MILTGFLAPLDRLLARLPWSLVALALVESMEVGAAQAINRPRVMERMGHTHLS